MTNFLISSKSQTSLITNTKCTLEKTWIVNTADIYAEPPQRQKFPTQKFFKSFAFQKSKESQNFLVKIFFFVTCQDFRHFWGLWNCQIWVYVSFYDILCLFICLCICHFYVIFDIFSIFFSVKPEIHLICLQGMSRDFG